MDVLSGVNFKDIQRRVAEIAEVRREILSILFFKMYNLKKDSATLCDLRDSALKYEPKIRKILLIINSRNSRSIFFYSLNKNFTDQVLSLKYLKCLIDKEF
jgi:hypothetical protein